ncbi:hypothetical protein N9798_02435 [Flavobacteriaceae bacterium]|jgi:hypothetical protein|nr:hypothetical protein [Flavobacteriaceae bacterium]
MKILYSKKKRKIDLFQGLFWILLGVLGLLFSNRKNVFFYLYFIMGLIHIYLYFKVKYYLSIENNIIKQNYIFGKKMDLSEIKSIKHFAGEYILRTYKRKMTINISWVDQSSLLDLTTELKKLDVKWI